MTERIWPPSIVALCLTLNRWELCLVGQCLDSMADGGCDPRVYILHGCGLRGSAEGKDTIPTLKENKAFFGAFLLISALWGGVDIQREVFKMELETLSND